MIPPLTTIDHIHVFVADRHAAEKWYTRVLGLKPITYLSAWAVDGGPLTLGNTEGTSILPSLSAQWRHAALPLHSAFLPRSLQNGRRT